MKIKSNLKNFGQFIELMGENGEPRKVISTLLKKIDSPAALVNLIYVGRRLITNDNLYLLSGRRHRNYFGLKINNKIYIKFGWHKIKRLTEDELTYLQNNWDLNFFFQKGMHLVEKSGGVLSYQHLLYTKYHFKHVLN